MKIISGQIRSQKLDYIIIIKLFDVRSITEFIEIKPFTQKAV